MNSLLIWQAEWTCQPISIQPCCTENWIYENAIDSQNNSSFFGLYLVAFDASSSELIFVATGAVNFLFAGNEALSADGVLADAAAETLLMPLPGLVFHLFSTCNKTKSTFLYQWKLINIFYIYIYMFLLQFYHRSWSSIKMFTSNDPWMNIYAVSCDYTHRGVEVLCLLFEHAFTNLCVPTN